MPLHTQCIPVDNIFVFPDLAENISFSDGHECVCGVSINFFVVNEREVKYEIPPGRNPSARVVNLSCRIWKHGDSL